MSDRGAPDPIIAQARKHWQQCEEAESAQRKRIVAAKKFRALDQWPDAIRIQREGGGAIAGQSPQPPRPCLTVDRLSQPVRQVSNTIKNADFGFDVMPNGMGADTETADIFKGYLRRMQNQSRGESPVEWAADGAIEGGIGWFRLRADYVHEQWDGAPTEELFDQELKMERITNNLTVYCDPSAMRPTRSDAQFMLVTEDMNRDDFERKYPKADLRGLEEFMSTGDLEGWVSDKQIRIAEYWTITYKNTPYYWLKDGTLGKGEAPKGADVRMTRKLPEPTVKGRKINACEVLETWDWTGSRIPLIPVLGEELNVDGKPVLRGIIEMGMDAQRMVNYTYSGAIEIYALSGKKAPMIPGAAIANYKAVWDTRNIINHSYLPYDPWDEQGRALPAPTLDTTDAPIQASVALMQVSEEAIKASTSTGDASLGNTNPNERSGKALNALQAQSDLANSNYPDNVRRALIYAAELALEVIPKITREGQILHILGMDDKPEQVMAGRAFKAGPNGVPEAAPPEITPEIAKVKESLYKFYDLNNGTYSVTVTVGKATSTRREEGAAALGELIPHLPPEMQIKVMPDYIKQLSFPGAQGIAEKLEPPGENSDIPPQVQQQMQQMQQENQQLKQMIQTEQVKTQATVQTAQLKAQTDGQTAQLREHGEMQRSHMDAQVKLEIARMDNATKLQIEEYKLRGAQMQAELDAREAALGAQQVAQSESAGRAHEAGMAAMSGVQGAQGAEADRSHQAQMAASGQQHESAEAAQARDAQGREADASRQHEAEMQAQQQAAAEAQAAQQGATE